MTFPLCFRNHFVASGSAGDAAIAVATFTTPTTIGDVNITTSALGGRTPVAAMFIMSRHQPATDPSATDGLSLMVGFTDGATSFVTYTGSTDNTSSTNTRRMQEHGAASTASCIWIATQPQSSVAHLEARNPRFITNGVTLDFHDADSGTAYRCVVVFFADPGFSAYVGTTGSLGTSATTTSITGVGFEPDVVLFASSCQADNDTGVRMLHMLGVAANDGSDTQKAVCWAESDLVGTGGRPAQTLHDARAIMEQSATAASLAWTGVVDNFGADGFDVTTDASAASDSIGFLALNFGGAPFKLWDFATPTSTGNASTTTPAFEPIFGMICGTNLESVNTSQYDAQVAGGYGLGVFTANDEATIAASIDSTADPTDTKCDTQLTALKVGAATTVDGVVASFVSMDANGWTLNYTTVQGNAKRAFALAIGAP